MATKKDDKKKLTKKPATKPVAKNPVAKKSTTKTASKPVAKKPEVKKKIEIEAKKIEKIVTTNSVIAKPTTQKYIEIKEPSYDESIIDLDFDNDPIVADEDEEVLFEAKKKEISHSGYTKLLEELKELEDVSVPSVNERIKEAREFGDLSENAEYKSALNEKQMLETRISELKEIVANSIVVDGSKK